MASVYDSIEVKGTQRFRRDRRFIAKDKVPANVMEVLTLDNIVDENGLIIVDKKNDEGNKVSPDEEKKLDANKNPETPEEGDQGDEPTSTNDNPPADPGDDDKPAPAAPPAPETSTDEDDDIDKPDETDKPGKKPAPKTRRAAKAGKFVSKVPQSRPGMGFPRVNGKTVDIFDGKTPHTHIKLIGGHTVPLSTDSFNNKTEKEIEDQLQDMGYELIDFTRDVSRDGLVEDKATPDDGLDGAGLTPDSV